MMRGQTVTAVTEQSKAGQIRLCADRLIAGTTAHSPLFKRTPRESAYNSFSVQHHDHKNGRYIVDTASGRACLSPSLRPSSTTNFTANYFICSGKNTLLPLPFSHCMPPKDCLIVSAFPCRLRNSLYIPSLLAASP